MSEPRLPIDSIPLDDGAASTIDITLTPIDGDARNINMNRLQSNPPAQDPGVIHLTGPNKGTVIRQPDGSWTYVPELQSVTPPQTQTEWSQPVTKVAGNSPLAGHGLMATLATLATVAIVGVAIVSGGGKTGWAPLSSTAPASTTLTTIPESPSSTVLIDSGAARANQIVTDIVKGCLSSNANMELTFEAAPGVDLAQIYEINPGRPDPLFDIETIQAANLYTVTITSLGPNNLGSKGRWAVDIASGGVVPLRPITGSSGGWDMYTVLMGRGCTTVENML